MTNTTIKTFSGRYIDLLDPKPEDFCVEDIAHSLANQCRWTGHTREFYSVAQHTVCASFILWPWFVTGFDVQWCKIALHHDSGEMGYGDLATPFKIAMGDAYQVIKQPIDDAIYRQFDLQHQQEDYERIIKPVDKLLLSLEGKWLVDIDIPPPDQYRNYKREDLGKLMERCWAPEEAEDRFLVRWEELCKADTRW